ncbi:Golgi membrane protein 1 [Brachionichthys hirsutus]|uniref:Golgi membrane protein 1 n=1 Tax=Brachionichthys hirsutus TaxID=412623 RepID=UPI0036051F8B
MGGLGNGRRGGRSPPLMIGALIACILLLGFNYWVSSSRNLELQTKLYELEGQVRRGAAERGVAEIKKNEFQEEIQRQKLQMTRLESLYKRQLDGAQNLCSQEKGTMQKNVSSSSKTIEELKGQLNQLNDDVGRLQKELQGCQGNIKTLNDKLTFDMTHCNSQVLTQKKLCDERVAAAKLEAQKNAEKPEASSHENTIEGAIKEGENVGTVTSAVKTSTDVILTPGLSQPEEEGQPELLTNDITVEKGPNAPVDLPPVKKPSKKEPPPVTSVVALKQDILQLSEDAVAKKEGEADVSKRLENNLTEDEGMELMDTHEEGAQMEDPAVDGMLTGQAKADEHQKLQEPDEYEGDERVVGGGDLVKQEQKKQPENTDLEQELANYNGDDENEGEFEADKQAELAEI